MSDQDELLSMLHESALRFMQDQSERPSSPDQVWQSMAELGWLGLALPESHGGAGLGAAEICTLTRLFGQYAFNTRYIGQCVMPSIILGAADINNPEVSSLSESLAYGTGSATLAWQEAQGQLSGDNPTAQLSQGKLSGNKCFVAGIDQKATLLVTAQNDNGLAIVIVPADAPGVTLKQSFDSFGGFGEVTFKDTPVNDNAIILQGNTASATLEHCLQASRLALAAELEGLASGCLDKTLEHLKTRKQFGHPLGAFQAIRHRCTNLLMETRLAESSWRRATKLYAPEQPQTSYQVSAAKARCGDAAFKIAKEGIQMHGAMGFVEETGIGPYMRNAITRGAWLGSATQHRNQLINAVTQGVFDV